MVQSFSTADAFHRFEVDGAQYLIPAFDLPDVDVMAEFAKLDAKAQAVAMRGFLADRSRSQRGAFTRRVMGEKSARDAVESLSFKQAADLFKAWASGVGEPGESLGSAVSR